MSTPCCQISTAYRLVVSGYEVPKVLVSQECRFFETPCSICTVQCIDLLLVAIGNFVFLPSQVYRYYDIDTSPSAAPGLHSKQSPQTWTQTFTRQTHYIDIMV